MIKTDYDVKRAAMIIEFKGDVDGTQAETAFADLETVLPKNGKEFVLLVDFSEVETMEPPVKSAIEKSMDFFDAKSVKEILRVLPDPAMDFGFRLMTSAHYSKHPKVITCRSREEAEALLQERAHESKNQIIEVHRFSLISAEPFETVLARLEAAVGRPDMSMFFQTLNKAETFSQLKQEVEKNLGATGLMLFMKLDHGGILKKEAGHATPKMVRYLVGNPLIMKEMVKHVADAGSYAPVTILVDERRDGVHLSYDRMVSFLAPYQNAEASTIARNLDAKVEALMAQAAGGKDS